MDAQTATGAGPPVQNVRMRGRTGAVVMAAGLLLGAGSPAYANGGLGIDSKNTYVVDPAHAQVRGRVEVTVTNDTPDETTSQGTRRYYFLGITVPVPAGARNVVATSAGSRLSVDVSSSKDPSTSHAAIRFPVHLYYGQTRRITLTFTVAGAAPRSKNTIRIGPGHATFPVQAVGDPGHTRVEVELPGTMTWDSTSTGFTETTSDGQRHLVTGTNNYPGEIWAIISARDAAIAKGHPVAAGGTSFTVVPWPDDPAWSRFADKNLKVGFPALQKLVGQPWPGGLLTIREDSKVNVYGYDGWYEAASAEIVVGEDLDQTLLFHELSHAWSSSAHIDPRWISEGLAEVLADRTTAAVGGKVDPAPTVTRTSKGAIPLDSWTDPVDGRSGTADAYAYPAARKVMTAALAGTTPEQFRAVLGGIVRSEDPYDKPGGEAVPGSLTTSHSLLDLLDNRGGNRSADALFKQWVLSPADIAALPARAKARVSYAALDRADGAWLPPVALRNDMSGWSFADTGALFTTIQPLAKDALAVQAAAAAAHLSVPPAIRSSYENAGDSAALKALATQLPQAAPAIAAVGAARAATRSATNPLARIGAAATSLDAATSRATTALAQGQLADAAREARAAKASADRSTLVGAGLVLLGLLDLLGLVLVGRQLLAWRRRRSGRQAAARAERRSVAGLQHPDHAGVAQGVGLDPLQVEELGDPLVVGPQQLGVDRRLDGLPLDRGEAVPAEEGRLEGEAEQPLQAEGERVDDQSVEQARSDAQPVMVGVDGERPHFAEVLPQDVQGPAAHDLPVDLGHPELR